MTAIRSARRALGVMWTDTPNARLLRPAPGLRIDPTDSAEDPVLRLADTLPGPQVRQR